MSLTLDERVRPVVLSSIAGRLRVHLPGWTGNGSRTLERRLKGLAGVHTVQANADTGNVLVTYDPRHTSRRAILAQFSDASHELPPQEEPRRPEVGPMVTETAGPLRRHRIAVRGLDRDAELAGRLVRAIHEKHGVRASASPLTGRLLVELTSKAVELADILSLVEEMEMPPLPGESRLRHPLDTAPLVQSAIRTAGAALGLGLITLRHVMGNSQPIVTSRLPLRVAGVLGLIQGFPFIRRGLRRLLGTSGAELAYYTPMIFSLAVSNSALGLALTGVEALRLLTEVMERRKSWRRYEDRLAESPVPHAGEMLHIEPGERAPLEARVVEGTGTATARDGVPRAIGPGSMVPIGARVHGGPFVVELQPHRVFHPEPRPAPVRPDFFDGYVKVGGSLSLAWALGVGLFTRSLAHGFGALLLFNPRTAVIGTDFAEISAFSRVLRGEVTVVGTREGRHLRVPHFLLLDSPRMLVEGFELRRVWTLAEHDVDRILGLAAGISVAAGSPWGHVFPTLSARGMHEGSFEAGVARARDEADDYSLWPAGLVAPGAPFLAPEVRTAVERHRQQGDFILLVCRENTALGLLMLRPRLAPGVDLLLKTCRRHHVRVAVVGVGDSATAQAIGRRSGFSILEETEALRVIRHRQAHGDFVAYVADHALAGEGFEACDMAIARTSGRGGRFPARADLLAPDLAAVACIVETAARRRQGSMASTALAMVSNVAGVLWGLRSGNDVERASRVIYVSALAACAVDAWLMRGGHRSRSLALRLADPRPERWGRRSIPQTLKLLESGPHGLTLEQVASRARPARSLGMAGTHLFSLVLEQFRSPLPLVLGGAAGLAILMQSWLDFAVIVATLGVNVMVGAWQERQAGEAEKALEQIGKPFARVLREGRVTMVAATELVIGDHILLAPGDRVAADARVLEAHYLEVDEAALTGESLPVLKVAAGQADSNRVVVEGSDVLMGTGRAVVVAVGRMTRLGATAAALAAEETEQSPLGERLGRMLRQVLPLAAGGGLLAFGAGVMRGRAVLSQLAVGASIGLAAVPEGLPLLAGVGQAAVARRLARRNVLVRRLSAVEALGRIDVACTDKTGTMTEGRLSLALVAGTDEEAPFPSALTPLLRHVLLTAAMASPHPDSMGARAHPTDASVMDAAEQAGLADEIRAEREVNAPFDPSRSFHAAVVKGCLCIKGAPEALVPRCAFALGSHRETRLDEAGREGLLRRARELAARGLRVLMVAEGSASASVDEPGELVALGFVGLRDPLRGTVAAAVTRCHEAGVRVIMLTGDHPETAMAVAREAGLPCDPSRILTGTAIGELDNEELDVAMERATVIARATPLDKLRIIESLQRLRHAVAMTGDGVNDAPALRLADVGVAMGRHGTEVARQAADLVLGDDDFATLVEALVEGRTFWRNMRRSLGLLLGGNAGELAMVVAATAVGSVAPLTTRQILAVNLVTDAIPALSVVLQEPRGNNLSELAREGLGALDRSLRRDVVRRGISTSLPSLGAYMLILASGAAPLHAQTVAFASVVATQLAQTLDSGWSEEGRHGAGAVTKAVGASSLLLASFMLLPPLQSVFGLAMPPLGWVLTGAAALSALVLNRALAVTVLPSGPDGARKALPVGGGSGGPQGFTRDGGNGKIVERKALCSGSLDCAGAGGCGGTT